LWLDPFIGAWMWIGPALIVLFVATWLVGKIGRR